MERSSGCGASFVFCFETGEERNQWESGKPASGFPLFHCRRGCGNVGIAQRLQGVGAKENLVLVSSASTAREFGTVTRTV